MGITATLSSPYFTGQTRSELVPGKFDVSINGRSYMVDLTGDADAFSRRSIPLLRNQANTGEQYGEASLNPEELWRRSQDSWDHGAGQCLTPETRVLTADLQWIPVGELAVGQRLIAFEEEPTTRKRREWRESVVTSTGRIMKPCYRILMSDGTKFVASYDHKWLKVVNETASWAESQKIQPASKAPTKSTKLVRLMEPWDFDGSRGAGYLAASFDGEGCLTQTSRPPRKDRLMLTFCQRRNGMLDRVKSELGNRNFTFSENVQRTDGYDDVVALNILGGTAEVLRLLGSVRPERLLPKFRPLNNGVIYGTPVEVLECEFIGEQEVVALSTSTETFIAEGYATHNTFLDREDSDRRRFRSSKGVDVWTRWGMSLLPDVDSKRASLATNLALQPVGDNLYLTDGASLLRTTSLSGAPTWTAVTGAPSAPTSITSDGFNVYTAHGASGVYRTTRGAASTTSYATGTATLVGYVKGRLMAAGGASLYNVTAGGALPTALFTHPNTDFTWVGFADGQAALYAAGFSGDKSLIYRIGIKSDGTGLDVPIVAGELPDGEIVRSISGYLSFLLLGTDKGVRFCATDAQGNLTIGALIKTRQAVLCFEGQDKYVWFGWSNYDSVSTGLGRLDLSTFIAPLTPAYASDLMATGQGAVTSVATFGDIRVFAVSGLGVFAQSVSLVPLGTLDTGLISYGLADPKTAVFVDVRLSSYAGSNAGYVAADGGTFVLVGTRTGVSDEPFQVGQVSGEAFEVRHELRRDSATVTAGPTISRFTLRSYPKTTRGEIFTVPLLLHEMVRDRLDTEVPVDVTTELNELLALQNSRSLVIYQVGDESHTVMVEDSVFVYSHRTGDGQAWNGTHNVKMKGIV